MAEVWSNSYLGTDSHAGSAAYPTCVMACRGHYPNWKHCSFGQRKPFLYKTWLKRVPELVRGMPGFYSAQGEMQVHEMGMKRISIPNHSTKSFERQHHQKQRWFRNGRSGEPVPKEDPCAETAPRVKSLSPLRDRQG
jgi:hypothetical protein